MAAAPRAVRIEADGGSRGNPGPAAYGAVLFDVDTGEVIADRAERIGVATNNVAEYRGLIAGLELYHEHAEGARLEVRMDSKLVIEQMTGRWKIKHPDMRPLATQAKRLEPEGTDYAWIPRERNTYADRILNDALDGKRASVDQREKVEQRAAPYLRSGEAGTPTTLLLVRHGVTAHTVDKRFSGGLGGSNPGLNDEGRDQARATAEWLAPLGADLDALVCSPVRRTRETAEIIAERLGKTLEEEPGLAEMDFGIWEGKTFTEVRDEHPDDLESWLGSMDHPPGGGESFTQVQERVLEGLDRLLADHAGQTVLAVSHVTPIKVLVARALGAPLESLYRMELAPASVTVLSFFEDGNAVLRMFNARPVDVAFTGR
ncbi:MAG: bifunctional RNase H/acid phosphatase [Nocardioides sp.]